MKAGKYRIMLVFEGQWRLKTDIIASIAVSPIRRTMILYVKTVKTDINVLPVLHITFDVIHNDNCQYENT